MASFPSSFSNISCRIFTPISPLPKSPKYIQVRAQRLRDEGNSANLVDANMNILSQRIEEVRCKERLIKACYNRVGKGWNYKPGYDDTHKRRVLLAESFELAALVGSTLGLVFLTGSIFVFLLSLVLLHSQS